jgi:hypothetical protein
MKLCECGCGQPAAIATKTDTRKGHVKGQPTRFAARHRESFATSFWSHVDKDGPVVYPDLGPCWMWTGATNSGGRGNITVDGKTVKAHRYSFFLEYGRWPTPCGCHKCDNGLCVRPSHIFEGTNAENSKDMRAKGRTPKGSQHGNAKINTSQAKQIRIRHAAGESMRKLAKEYGINPVTAWAVVHHITWTHC